MHVKKLCKTVRPNWVFEKMGSKDKTFPLVKTEDRTKAQNMKFKFEDCIFKCADPNANFGWLDS